jgi:hypothetical protein
MTTNVSYPDSENAVNQLRRENRSLNRQLQKNLTVWMLAGLSLTWGINTHSGPILRILLFILSLSCAILATKNLLQMRDRPVLRRVLESKDVLTIGVLLETLAVCEGSEHQTLLAALTELLPRMDAADASLLNVKQYDQLDAAFYSCDMETEFDFLIAILKAYCNIGDEHALHRVERLSTLHAVTEQEQKVCNAARECLPVLRERLERQRLGKDLLRPASSTDSSHTLLRPACSVSASAPETLLRPFEESIIQSESQTYLEKSKE